MGDIYLFFVRCDTDNAWLGMSNQREPTSDMTFPKDGQNSAELVQIR